jgi:glucose/arabinose dehydrogenase
MASSHFLKLMTVATTLGLSCGGRSSPAQPDGNVAVRLEPVASGLDFPLDLKSPPGDSRLFVVEKTGKIKIIKSGAVLPKPFLDLSALISNGGEQGLLGVAFHPRYATNGVFVVDYTDTSGDTRIARYHVSADPDVADPASGEILLGVDQPYSNHNGGGLLFGPDGFLYISLGDGGSGGDPQNHGQDRRDLLGSILRIDVDHGSPYGIPGSNPYAQSTTFRHELWNYGMRNPWRFSFDRENGDLYIADVGQDNLEEVDVAPHGSSGGENYGWRIMEGSSCYQSSGCDRTGLVLPVLEYSHSDGCSITGGYVYRGQAIPALRGTYFYSDYCNGWIRSFRYRSGQASDQREWSALKTSGSVTSFGEDAAGELYVLIAAGNVYRIAP